MNIIKKDILTVESGIIFHQVNCKGIMGGGVALALASKYPGLEQSYQDYIRKITRSNTVSAKDSSVLLGHIDYFAVINNQKPNDGLYIINVFGQDDISRSKRMTSYDATVEAFENFLRRPPNFYYNMTKADVYFPYQMGCGLGGGNWKIYASIIDAYFPKATICQL